MVQTTTQRTQELLEIGEILPGVYLYSREEIIEEQKTWEEGDLAEDIDFNDSDLWITTDDGHVESITEEELIELTS